MENNGENVAGDKIKEVNTVFSINESDITEIISFYPPEGLNSLEVGFLSKTYATRQDVLSLIPFLAYKGYIKIEIAENNFKIYRLKTYDGENEYEKLFMKALFSNPSIIPKDSLMAEYSETLEKGDYFGVKKNEVAQNLGNIMSKLLGKISVDYQKKEIDPNILGQIKGLKTFLETAEKDKLEQLIAEDPNYYYKMISFAYVLGVSNKWISQFEMYFTDTSKWFAGADIETIRSCEFLIGEFLNNSAWVGTIKAVGSAGDSLSLADVNTGPVNIGFNGGGFSGGGSGGGGGSSW